MKENVRLLVDGKESFKQIIKRIREAKKSIYMNVFIWRDDVIGNMIAKELLAAADKGVKITVSKDRLGGIYEKAEENKQSFLHKYLDTRQWIKQKTIDIFYHPHLKAVGGWQKENRLVDQLLKHKNIRILRSKIKKDHSKYYIFDNEIFVTGGINIEDRTIARDIRGSRWNDYMIEIKGKEFVNRLKQRINGDANYDADSQLEFVLNINKRKKFEIKRTILRLLSDAKTVDIQMAYFGDKDIINKIISAANNGTKVRIILPRKANVQNDFNQKIMKRIFRKTKGNVEIFLFTNMLHAKMIHFDKETTLLGSANLNSKAMNKLSELNVLVRGNGLPFNDFVKRSIEHNRKNSERVTDIRQFKYNKTRAFLEGFFN